MRGSDGAPPYLVQFKDGRKRLLFPGPDAVIESSTAAEVEQRVGRRIHTRPGW